MLPKLLLLGDRDRILSLALPRDRRSCHPPLLGKERTFPKMLDVFFAAAAAQVSHPIALQSGVSQVFSLKEPHPVETAQE